MKQKEGFGLRNVCGEHVLVAEGIENINFSQIVSFNETSAYLWEKLEGKTFEIEDMVDLLCAEYEVTHEVAYHDCAELAKKWIEAGLIEK